MCRTWLTSVQKVIKPAKKVTKSVKKVGAPGSERTPIKRDRKRGKEQPSPKKGLVLSGEQKALFLTMGVQERKETEVREGKEAAFSMGGGMPELRDVIVLD